jgi:hypothetical protein
MEATCTCATCGKDITMAPRYSADLDAAARYCSFECIKAAGTTKHQELQQQLLAAVDDLTDEELDSVLADVEGDVAWRLGARNAEGLGHSSEMREATERKLLSITRALSAEELELFTKYARCMVDNGLPPGCPTCGEH